MDGYFNVMVHYGGKFVDRETLNYLGENIKWNCDTDIWSYFDLNDTFKEMECLFVEEMWYFTGVVMLEIGLKSLTDDKGAIEMINIARRDGSVHLFVLHLVLKKTEISNNINGSGQHNVVVDENVQVPNSLEGQKNVLLNSSCKKFVVNLGEKFFVNLQKNECNFRKWLMTKIPCSHAIVYMKFLHKDPTDYIPTCFKKEAYAAFYAPIIHPINGGKVWKRTW